MSAGGPAGRELSDQGRGIYLPAQAARLTQLDDNRRQWIGGYDFKARDGAKRRSAPLFRRRVPLL
jgi:hypothetical protein